MAARLTLLLALLLSGCAHLGATAWDHSDPNRCEAARGEFCRDGKGVLVWWTWDV